MNPNAEGTCWSCGHRLLAADYGREGRCPACAKATHACRNCRFYAPGRANDCLEPIAERVIDKERPNFCDLFEPAATAGNTAAPSAEDLRSAAEALFRSSQQ
jgi:predicted RNA-binding Zn-ribbon protein involved in translation (DUF1610 family)